MEKVIIVLLLLAIFFLVIYHEEAYNKYQDWYKWYYEEPGCSKVIEEAPLVKTEHLQSDFLDNQGYTSYNDLIAKTELDPSTFSSHQEFVKDVRRFSSGANFTSVTDDNTNLDFVNFQGLNRPQHVPIGAGARQIPDIDESVLKRNKYIRFT